MLDAEQSNQRIIENFLVGDPNVTNSSHTSQRLQRHGGTKMRTADAPEVGAKIIAAALHGAIFVVVGSSK